MTLNQFLSNLSKGLINISEKFRDISALFFKENLDEILLQERDGEVILKRYFYQIQDVLINQVKLTFNERQFMYVHKEILKNLEVVTPHNDFLCVGNKCIYLPTTIFLSKKGYKVATDGSSKINLFEFRNKLNQQFKINTEFLDLWGRTNFWFQPGNTHRELDITSFSLTNFNPFWVEVKFSRWCAEQDARRSNREVTSKKEIVKTINNLNREELATHFLQNN